MEPEFELSAGEGMSRLFLSKTELAKLVLAEIRKNGGCEGVAEVVIVERVEFDTPLPAGPCHV